ncbi:MAG: RNA-guided endonuclease TnpB family protein [Candidatus Bathyarchaeota archaeon]|nr:RNA-guided endonuclease TnpB family protein [Candidatus Bathyarchaeota archaeon]
MRLTIQAGVVGLTRRKKELLDREYSNLQKFLRGDKTVPLYSANKHQALRYYRRVKHKEYPLSLRNDLINLRRAKAFWFLKIPVYGVRGGIKVPVKPHREFPENAKLCESKIVKRKDRYIAMLTFEFPAPPVRECFSILSVDLGERFVATAVLWQNGSVMKALFYGKEIRGVRRHYAWLRRRLQERGLTQVVKRVGGKERRMVNVILHRVSKRIVNLALATNSYIVLGDLKGIRQRVNGKGKRLNRIVSNMPYYRLTKMIEYKAMLVGIPVITTSEAYTSITCHVCGCEGKRETQGLFVCAHCGEYSADLNGAINVAKKFERWMSYMPIHGAERVNQPITSLSWKPHP